MNGQQRSLTRQERRFSNTSLNIKCLLERINSMKHFFLTFSLIILSLLANAQSNKIVIGTIDTLNSKILNEKRAVWVYVPNQEQKTIAKTRYPVVYLLDGDWHFYSVVGTIQQMSFVNGNTICPEMIVVGIPNTDRFRDLTPTCDSTFSPSTGGNEKFISFIEKELIPYIDSTYPVDPYRMLIGHSLGGLTVINTLINHTNLFNSYVAIDPSMWWNKQKYLRETEKALSEKKYNNVSLFLGVAISMEPGMDTIKIKKDATPNTRHIRSMLEFVNCLKMNKQNALNYQYKYYDNENHGSVPHIATYDALHFVFNYYNLPLTRNEYSDSSMTLPNKIENHYKNISEIMGYKVYPSENTVNVLAYNAMGRNNYVVAEYFFKLNIKNYPESFNGYDSYGDYYIAVGDEPKAIVMFTKALSIKESPETREKLRKLQGKQ